MEQVLTEQTVRWEEIAPTSGKLAAMSKKFVDEQEAIEFISSIKNKKNVVMIQFERDNVWRKPQ